MKIRIKIPKWQGDAVIALKTGDIADDGSIYLGVHGDREWFATAQDARYDNGRNMMLSFNEASAYAKDLIAHRNGDWQLPPGANDPNGPDILRALYEAQNTGAFKDTFPLDGPHPKGWYWSSTPCPNSANAWDLRMKDGEAGWGNKASSQYVRCVRSTPIKP